MFLAQTAVLTYSIFKITKGSNSWVVTSELHQLLGRKLTKKVEKIYKHLVFGADLKIQMTARDNNAF